MILLDVIIIYINVFGAYSTPGVLVGDQGVSTQTGVLLTCYQCDIWTSVDHGGDLFTRFPTKSVCIIFHIPNCLCVTLSHNQR